MTLALSVALAYLIGSFPTAYLVGRARGVDPGSRGSGNYGATNVYRTLGPGPAALTLMVDVGKGFLPVLLFPRWLPSASVGAVTQQVVVALAAILGHVFPLFLAFRGGKGVGTAAGAYLALTPWATLAAAVLWITVLLWRRIASLASLSAAVGLVVAVWALHASRLPRTWPLLGVTTLLAAFVFWTHRDNIVRLRRGEEKPIASGGRRGAG